MNWSEWIGLEEGKPETGMYVQLWARHVTDGSKKRFEGLVTGVTPLGLKLHNESSEDIAYNLEFWRYQLDGRPLDADAKNSLFTP